MTPHGARFTVEGEGMLDPGKGTYGDLVMVVEVQWPRNRKIVDAHREELSRMLKGEKLKKVKEEL